MKQLIHKLTAYLVAAFALIFSLASCFQKPPLVLEVAETYIVIEPDNDQIPITENMTLLDCMQELKEDGELQFELKDGMITSVNGIENAADWSNCWMLYTSDEDNANTAWGTVEYVTQVFGSAISGAETLKIKDGYLYIWVYQSF